MSPYEQAALAYLRCKPAICLRDALEAHLFSGHVFNTPEVFLMGRRVDSWWQPEDVFTPALTSPDGDCWHVWLAAGNIKEALRLMPVELPWISFEHRGRLKIVPVSRFFNRT